MTCNTRVCTGGRILTVSHPLAGLHNPIEAAFQTRSQRWYLDDDDIHHDCPKETRVLEE